MRKRFSFPMAAALNGLHSLARQGDRAGPAGEKQLERVPPEKIPPAPPHGVLVLDEHPKA